ncbi:UDP-glucuronosyl/UDP-glucosyltransferase [Macleaya cordata]|uniref:UDP-glucuronosyl/UDP-glucosyltransferase n=1 Tax=Macleaya cordata TaxID=56857 RepID=A0A200QG08_MACCD|nr:UDP-glucuronosyl/UDP-glucosyltransferase [Macleaya cordata]
MFPWLAMGHLTPYLHLSNKLSERGHKISFFAPTKTISKLEYLNLHPHLISFVPLVVPYVDGLPLGVETMSDIPPSTAHFFPVAFHRLQNQVEYLLHHLKPDFVFYDFAGWIPALTRPLGIKSIHHFIVSAASWDNWLGGFKAGSVLYCAFGSERVLRKDQFQELVLGFELTAMPFFVALKPPAGAMTVDEALSEGFEERVCGRGVVHRGWVQQPQILAHPSVGYFVSHCEFVSLWESLMNDCQIVLIPNIKEQYLNAMILSGDLKVAVEVKRREEDGWFTKEGVRSAVKAVMDE